MEQEAPACDATLSAKQDQLRAVSLQLDRVGCEKLMLEQLNDTDSLVRLASVQNASKQLRAEQQTLQAALPPSEPPADPSPPPPSQLAAADKPPRALPQQEASRDTDSVYRMFGVRENPQSAARGVEAQQVESDEEAERAQSGVFERMMMTSPPRSATVAVSERFPDA